MGTTGFSGAGNYLLVFACQMNTDVFMGGSNAQQLGLMIMK